MGTAKDCGCQRWTPATKKDIHTHPHYCLAIEFTPHSSANLYMCVESIDSAPTRQLRCAYSMPDCCQGSSALSYVASLRTLAGTFFMPLSTFTPSGGLLRSGPQKHSRFLRQRQNVLLVPQLSKQSRYANFFVVTIRKIDPFQ